MNGDIHARKTYRQGYLVLNVTHNYRLLFRNDIWNVLSHEAYNKIKER